MKTNLLKIWALALCLSTILILGCKDSDLSPSEEGLINFNSVTGKITRTFYYDYDGNEVRFSMDTVYYNFDSLINGVKWYGKQGDIRLFRNKADGLYSFFIPLQEEYLLYKYPVKKNETFQTLNYQGESYNNEQENPYNITRYEMLVADTKASATMKYSSNSYEGLIHYKKAKLTPSTNGQILPGEWFVLPGKGTVLFRSYYDEDFTKISVYSETTEFF
ncbi:MAG: hypothetical protein NXI00_07145 [Cytophagales bacterium]|nr:hypothetical protein [Cytophagales bacterium]